MHYRAKEFPLHNLIADAEALMRELNRAIAAVDGQVDQNNLKDIGVDFNFVRDSAGADSIRSTSLVGITTASSVICGDTQSPLVSALGLEPAKNQYSGSDDEAKRNQTWQYLRLDASRPLEVRMEITETTRLFIVVNGQIEVGESNVADTEKRFSEFDVRVLVNNTPLDQYGTFVCTCDAGFMPFHVEANIAARPGTVVIRAQIRDRTPSPVDGSSDPDIGFKQSNTYIYCYGHTR